MIRKTLAAGALCLAAAATPARAADGYAFEAGHGDDDTNLWRVALQWKWHWKARERHRFHMTGYWDLSFGAWSKDHTLYDVGFTPVFRLQREDGPGPYAEAAIGFHFLSEVNIAQGRVFSSHFQFGDHIGLGYRFGEGGKYDVSVRVQHLSNGGIDSPNPGINFLQLRLQVHR
jgi:lipid A 3-O-deacylase